MMLAAQVVQRLQHWRIRPETLDCRSRAVPGAPAPPSGQAFRQFQDGRFADPRWTGEQQRAAVAAHRLIQAVADQVANLPSAIKPSTWWSPSVGRATQLGLEPIAKLLRLRARHDAEFPLKRPLHSFVLPA